MSRIYFHSLEETVEVHGSERAHFGIFCAELAWAIIGSIAEEWGGRPSPLRAAIPPDHYLHSSGQHFPQQAKTNFRVGGDNWFLGDTAVDLFSLQLNTALFMGSDPVKLAARLHGQCEIHAYVEGGNRKWLASIIRQGREIGFYRSDSGWEGVIEMLEATDTGPVVTSYSICDQFPNAYAAGFTPPVVDEEKDWDAWYDLPYAEQWEMGISALRQGGGGLELTPDRWAGTDFYFSHGIDANKFIAQLLNARAAAQRPFPDGMVEERPL